jgi:hypothetical protein
VSGQQGESVPTLLITGTVGVGKSTVAAEINDALADLKIPSAAVDLDALVWQWPSTSNWNSDRCLPAPAGYRLDRQPAHGPTNTYTGNGASAARTSARLHRHRPARVNF